MSLSVLLLIAYTSTILATEPPGRRLDQIIDQGTLPTADDVIEHLTHRAYNRCLATLGEVELCRCVTHDIPLRFNFLCYARLADAQKTSRPIAKGQITIE
ncbi:MAG: hypothetical protein ACE5K1_05800 [Acidiferrobacterales bacterium]